MRYARRVLVSFSLVSLLSILQSCTYEQSVQHLSLPERAQLDIYRKIMTPAQRRTYLAKATAAERTAYLSEVGLAQRFQAFDPLDRDAIISGLPRPGMSAEALRFAWGDPYYTAGQAQHSAHWFYLGTSLGMAGPGANRLTSFGQRVDVYLADGQVVSWVDYTPSGSDERGNGTFR